MTKIFELFSHHFNMFLFTDDVIDETYGVAVQFDEEEEEVHFYFL